LQINTETKITIYKLALLAFNTDLAVSIFSHFVTKFF